jgi:predicted PilT family ATPase
MRHPTIDNKSEWVRNIKEGETKTCSVKMHNELDSLATTVGRINRGFARVKGIKISYVSDYDELTFTITAKKRNDDNKS